MALVIPTQQLILPTFSRFLNNALGNGAVLGNGKFNVMGYRRVVGNFHAPGGGVGPAAGSPLVEQSMNGTDFDLATVIPQDVSQPDVQFPFDIELVGNYLRVTYTNGAGIEAFVRGWVYCLPH